MGKWDSMVKDFKPRSEEAKQKAEAEKAQVIRTYEQKVRGFDKPVYSVKGNRGKTLYVCEDHIRITVDVTVGSVITGNATDGEKIIFYDDCIGIQYKRCGALIGYLQLETASPIMNNKSENFFNENAFTFDDSVEDVMYEVYEYIFRRVQASKKNNSNIQKSVSTELEKLKILLDNAVINEEEYTTLKKKLIGI